MLLAKIPEAKELHLSFFGANSEQRSFQTLIFTIERRTICEGQNLLFAVFKFQLYVPFKHEGQNSKTLHVDW